jgi:methylglutaconyl-CoA hydratase
VSDELVHYELANGVATLTLDSPTNRNALSRQLTADLDRQVQRALADERARIIVLTAQGPAFCSGADLKESRDANVSGTATGPAALVPVLTALWNSPKPVVGRINGAARAGGIGLIAACDISIAVESATFAISEVRIGVIPAIISVLVLPKLGLTRVTELFLTGEPFNAAEAVTMGLLTASCASDALDDTVETYVKRLRLGAPKALAGAKSLLRDVPGMPLDAAFAETAKRSAAYFASEEAREGMTAFTEKRSPAWQLPQPDQSPS